jgi:hypothetical protein
VSQNALDPAKPGGANSQAPGEYKAHVALTPMAQRAVVVIYQLTCCSEMNASLLVWLTPTHAAMFT